MTTAVASHTERTLVVGGKNVRLLEGGSGPTVVVLHHSTGNPGWVPFYDELAKKFSVVVPDMPGYGQSDRPEWAREPRDIAILMNRLLEQLGSDSVTLVGLGLGGFIASEMATMNQTRLKSLVLVGAPGLQPENGEILDQMLIDFEEYVKSGFRDETQYHAVFGEELAPEIKQLWDFSREMTARITWKPYMFSRKMPNLLCEVTVPTLILHGDDDRVVPPVCAQQYAKLLPNAKVEVIPGGHLVEYEDPAAVANLVASHAGVA